MGRSPGFASADCYSRPIQTRFPYGYTLRLNLATIHNSLAHYAKGTRSPQRAPTVCRHTVSGSFHSPLGVLFTFPSRYSFTIGQSVVLSLGRWSSQIPPGFLVSEGTQGHCWPALCFVYGAFTLYGRLFQVVPLHAAVPYCRPYNPTAETCRGLGYSAFARRY